MTKAGEAAEERPDPHEEYGVRPVPKSRQESLGSIQAELQREMARRAGAYGRQLLKLYGELEAAGREFDEGLRRLIHEDAGRRWSELVAGADGELREALRAVERSRERHEALRGEVEAVRLSLIIHREAMGFRRHHLVEEKFPPPEALPPLEAAWRRASSGPDEPRS